MGIGDSFFFLVLRFGEWSVALVHFQFASLANEQHIFVQLGQ